MNDYDVQIIVIVVNSERKFLVTTRSKKEEILPGVNSYNVGKLALDDSQTKSMNIIEDAVRNEVVQETSIQVSAPTYLGSFKYASNHHKYLALGFLTHHKSGEIKVNSDEIEDAKWLDIEDIRRLNTNPFVLEMYETAYISYFESLKMHKVSVAGIVLDNDGRYMLTKDSSGSGLKIPTIELESEKKGSWEVLSRALANGLNKNYGTVLMDGAIPFTDQSVQLDSEKQGLIYYFIARTDKQTSDGDNYVWKTLAQIDTEKLDESVKLIISKASNFINSLNN